MLRTARRLDAALAGGTLVRTELRWPDLGGVDLAGRTVVGVASYGKHILTRLAGDAGTEPLTLRSHLRMEGQWRIAPPGNDHWPDAIGVSVRAVLATADWTAIGRWLGLLDLIPTAAEGTLIGHLGPDIMTDEFPGVGRAESIARISAAPSRHIGAALLDQTTVAGIGTMYMAEALFVQHISPWTPAAEVDLGAVLDTARRLLLRGATSALPSTTGNPRPGHNTYVHARSGRPCVRCGTTVRVAPIGPALKERTAFYCAVCQPGPTPTDDGRVRRPLGAKADSSRSGYRRLR